MRITWFVISPHLAAVNQAQSTKLQLFGTGSLGLCAKEKKHSHKVPGEVAMAEEVRERWVMKFDGSFTTHSEGVGVVLYHE